MRNVSKQVTAHLSCIAFFICLSCCVSNLFLLVFLFRQTRRHLNLVGKSLLISSLSYTSEASLRLLSFIWSICCRFFSDLFCCLMGGNVRGAQRRWENPQMFAILSACVEKMAKCFTCMNLLKIDFAHMSNLYVLLLKDSWHVFSTTTSGSALFTLLNGIAVTCEWFRGCCCDICACT